MNKVDRRTSYTAADIIPLKVLLDKDLLQSTQNGKIIPLHIQFMPTNKCNLKCVFCSCSERNKSLEMPFDDAKRIIDDCKLLGTKAVTISGGGEPLCYPNFEELIEYFNYRGIKIGMVTNGLLLHKINSKTLSKITWCRISSGDDRDFNDNYNQQLHKVVTENNNVDWAFSHVITSRPNIDTIKKIIKFANEHNFTHVRLVADLFTPEFIDMRVIKSFLSGLDDSLVIYQGRKEYTKGTDCYICYLKPVIAPDLKVYACCGAQYALETPTKDMPEELSLGDARDIWQIIDKSIKPFNGAKCVKCYYSGYNSLLNSLLSKIEHQEFV